MKYSEYCKTIPIAESIYFEIFCKPETNEQNINKINTVAKINLLLISKQVNK